MFEDHGEPHWRLIGEGASGMAEPATKDIKVAYGIDVDAVAGWLGSYGGEDSPDDISRGLFAGEIGVLILLAPGPIWRTTFAVGVLLGAAVLFRLGAE